MKRMPAQRPGQSFQDYGTPPEFIAAVEARFGPIRFDLAASPHNAVVPEYFSEADDSLSQEWPLKNTGWLWLNPRFSNIEPWAAKCAEEMQRGCRILMLTPAAVGSNWFGDHVVRNAHVIELAQRIRFVGAKDDYPKDLILSVFAHRLTGRSRWKWKKEIERADGREKKRSNKK